MKALQFDSKGDLNSLVYRDVPDAKAAAGEVLVAVKAAGLNPSDVKNVLGRFPYTTVPRIAGRDFAGTVVAGPAEWQGKDVFGCAVECGFHRDGSHAELLAVTPSALIEKPARLSFAKAASLGVPYVTAWEVVKRARLAPSSRAVILGAGAVALAAAKLLRWQGVQPVLALRNANLRATLTAAGETCLDLSNSEQLPAIVEAHFGQRADFVFDSTGFLLKPAVLSVANYGQAAVIAAPATGDSVLPLQDFYRRGITLIGVNSLLHDNRSCNDLLRELLPALASGELEPAEPECHPLADGVAAYRALHEGHTAKQVLII